MSRFADPTRTEVYTFPDGCQCPGDPRPHDSDWIRMRAEMSAADAVAIAESGSNIGAMQVLAVEWNLLDDKGELAPLNGANIGRLFSANFEDLDAWIDNHVVTGRLPKQLGARSSTGTPPSARPNRAQRRQRRSTSS